MKPGLIVTLSLALLSAGGLAATGALAKPKPAAANAGGPPPPPGQPTDADWRTPDPDNVLVIDTSKGRVFVELSPIAAPVSVARIKELTRDKFYDGRSFFRVMDNFMDQTGDPLDSGAGQSSLPNIGPEFNFKRGADTPFVQVGRRGGQEEGFIGAMPIISQTMDLALLTVDHKVDAWGVYCAGTLGMARSDDPQSQNSQFFLMRTNAEATDHGNHALDQRYTAFGRVIAGQDVVDAIKAGAGQDGHVDAPQDTMTSVKVLADIPAASRPKIRVVDPSSAWMKAEVAHEEAAQGDDYTVCDDHVPVRIE